MTRDDFFKQLQSTTVGSPRQSQLATAQDQLTASPSQHSEDRVIIGGGTTIESPAKTALMQRQSRAFVAALDEFGSLLSQSIPTQEGSVQKNPADPSRLQKPRPLSSGTPAGMNRIKFTNSRILERAGDLYSPQRPGQPPRAEENTSALSFVNACIQTFSNDPTPRTRKRLLRDRNARLDVMSRTLRIYQQKMQAVPVSPSAVNASAEETAPDSSLQEAPPASPDVAPNIAQVKDFLARKIYSRPPPTPAAHSRVQSLTLQPS